MASYGDIKRTISGHLMAGNRDRAKKYAADAWDSLSGAQRAELTSMGVAPSLSAPSLGANFLQGRFNNTKSAASSTINGAGTAPNASAISGALRGATSGIYGRKVKQATTPVTSPVTNNIQQQLTDVSATLGAMPTYDSEYMDKLNAVVRQLTEMNYDDWTKGSQYQALAERYGNNGKMSMQDVLGQIASRTGGLASSYATTAAQQQYNQYMAQLEDVARQMYSQDRSELMDNANLYRNLANDEYDRYRDSVADYNAQLKAVQAAAKKAYSDKSSIDGDDDTEAGLDNYDDVKNNILMYASRGMDSVSQRVLDQVWDQLSASQQDDIIETLRKKGWTT